MNAQTILNAITAEKEKFLAQYEDKAYFKKKSSVFFTDFINKADRFGDTSLFFILILIIAGGYLSVPLSFRILDYIKHSFHFTAGPAIEFPLILFLCVLFIVGSTKLITSSITTWKYYRRSRSNSIEQLFAEDFYDSEVSLEIKNMLKLLLSEDQYFKLREGKPQITYKDAKAAIDSIIERESVIEEKHEVFLSPEEIKKYSYVNAG